MENHYSPEIICENIKKIKSNVARAAIESGRAPEDIFIMGVTKTVPADVVNIAIDNGINLLGENRVQEMLSKYEIYNLRKANIHFIGSLQTNKVKYIIDKVSMVHSVDSFKLAKEIDKQCAKIGKIMDILIEINIGKEDSKGGIIPEVTEPFLKEVSKLSNVKVRGLMAIPPFSEKIDKESKYFLQMNKLFVDIKGKKLDNINMDFLSMGMSNDYYNAIASGANIVRIGTSLFGGRKY